MSEFITATKNGMKRKFSMESWRRSKGDWVEVVEEPQDVKEATKKVVEKATKKVAEPKKEADPKKEAEPKKEITPTENEAANENQE